MNAEKEDWTPAKVREVRAKRRLTQAELGDLLGFSENYIYQIEAGKKPLTSKLIKALNGVRSRLSTPTPDRNMVAFEEPLPYQTAPVPRHAATLAEALKDSLDQGDLETSRNLVDLLGNILNPGEENADRTS